MALMQVFMKPEYNDDPSIQAVCNSRSPRSIYEEEAILLQTVACLYYSRHGFTHYDPWITFALAIIGNTIIADLASPAAATFTAQTMAGYRSLLILSAQGLHEQSMSYHNGTLIAIQLQKAMHPADLQLTQRYATAAHIPESDQALIEENSHSQWPVPGISRLDADPEESRLYNLLRSVEDADKQ